MSNKIQEVRDKTGNTVFPITHERAVRDSSGVTLETKLQDLQSTADTLELQVSNLSGKYYGVFASAAALPNNITADGYAFVGAQAPYAIYNFDGTEWADSGAEAQAIYGEPGADGVGLQTVTSLMDGTVVLSLTSGDTVTIDLNHNHPQYPKYVYCSTQAAYDAITTKESDTLYLILETS